MHAHRLAKGLAALLCAACTTWGAPGCRSPDSELIDSGPDAPTRDAGPFDGPTVVDGGADGGSPEVHPLPLLDDGNHLGAVVGFSSLPEATRAEVDRKWAELVEAGMGVARIQLDWAELEPRPGEYDEGVLRVAMDEPEANGLQVFLTLGTIDTESFVLPVDLMDPEDPTKLAGGVRLDDPAILARFRSFLTWLVPRFVAREGFALSVGNEPDNHLHDLPPEFMEGVRGFVEESRRHSHTVAPELGITVTLMEHSVLPGASYTAELMSMVDVATFNYYCPVGPERPFDPAAVDRTLDAMLRAAGDKPVVIQELGCSAGFEDRASTIGTSLETQRAFFERAFAKLHREPRLRAAFVFTLVDYSPELAEAAALALRAEGLHELAEQYRENLLTLGVLRYEDGSSRPAFGALLDGVAGTF